MVKKSSVGGGQAGLGDKSKSSAGAAPVLSLEKPKELDETWSLNMDTQCFEKIMGGRRFVFVNGAIYSFTEDDPNYIDAVLDSLDPKVEMLKNDRPSPEVFPGGVPPLTSKGWYYDSVSGFYMKDGEDGGLDVQVYDHGNVLYYTAEEVAEGTMELELEQLADEELRRWEENLDSYDRSDDLENARAICSMWGLDDYMDEEEVKDIYSYMYGGYSGGYDVDEDLAELRHPKEDT